MIWFLLDAALVVAFAAAGRSSHDESLTLGGIADTAWPFLVGLVIGWLVVVLNRKNPLGIPAGLIIWPATVIGGMALRALTGAGTAWPFVIVATIVTGALLVGWRAIAQVRHIRSGE